MQRFRWATGVAVLTLAVVFGIVATAASSQRAATKTITPSPPWTAAQLSAPTGDNWLEYYGSLNGNRYSSLNQITTSNVSTLKQVWQISLGTCSAAVIAGSPVIPGASNGAANNPTNCGSLESNPVAVDGVLYTIAPPLGKVFAIDAATGNVIWSYTPSYAGEILNNGRRLQPGQRRASAGRRGRRGQGLLRPAGRPRHRVGSDQRTAGLGDVCRVVQEQREGLQRPDLRQRRASRRRRLGRQRRQQPVAPGLQGSERRSHLVLDAGPVARSARFQDVDERRQGRQRQQPLRRRLVLGVPGRRHLPQLGDRRHRQPRAVELTRPGSEPLHRLDRRA